MNSQRLHGEFSSPHPSKNGTRLILSVDDEPRILVSRQLILESEGCEVLSAADGEQALETFAGQPVDLVLLDYVMPGMDGGVVAKAIKNHNPRVPVVIVSASPVRSSLWAAYTVSLLKETVQHYSWRRSST
jgi:CheY-like chemotaxis protein